MKRIKLIDNNIIRTTIQATAAILGGTQSLHTNSKDEALSLPTERAAKTALRTQQILAYETGLPDVVDPLAGSHYIESLTKEIENRTFELINFVLRPKSYTPHTHTQLFLGCWRRRRREIFGDLGSFFIDFLHKIDTFAVKIFKKTRLRRAFPET